MDELYGYLTRVMNEMYAKHKTTAEIDMEHLFKTFRVVCHMMQIKDIANFDDKDARIMARINAGEGLIE